jgi:hypothetical protein
VKIVKRLRRRSIEEIFAIRLPANFSINRNKSNCVKIMERIENSLAHKIESEIVRQIVKSRK